MQKRQRLHTAQRWYEGSNNQGATPSCTYYKQLQYMHHAQLSWLPLHTVGIRHWFSRSHIFRKGLLIFPTPQWCTPKFICINLYLCAVCTSISCSIQFIEQMIPSTWTRSCLVFHVEAVCGCVGGGVVSLTILRRWTKAFGCWISSPLVLFERMSNSCLPMLAECIPFSIACVHIINAWQF